MGTFDDRDQAFENKFAHDRQAEFKAVARRNKLLGLWAAEKLGLKDEAAADYAKEVVAADFEAPGDDDVRDKVARDFKDADIAITPQEVRYEMDRLLTVARRQLSAGQ
jgi:hypothetical protein